MPYDRPGAAGLADEAAEALAMKVLHGNSRTAKMVSVLKSISRAPILITEEEGDEEKEGLYKVNEFNASERQGKESVFHHQVAGD